MNRIIVFDTNVLLTDAQALLSYPGAEILIPETVLSEIDKLKTARVDPDLRYRGRNVSRLLFDLTDGKSLIDGVTIDNGATVRVVPFDFQGSGLPDGFTTKNSDDKILATAYLAKKASEDKQVYLITNDLNMLLKAQTYGVPVEQYGSGNDVSWAKKYIVRPFQRYRVSLTILGVSMAVFFGTVFVASSMNPADSNGSAGTLTTEYRQILTEDEKTAWDALTALKADPSDAPSLRVLGNFFYARAETARVAGDQTAMVQYSEVGSGYYDRYLSFTPTDANVRVDMATLYFYSGEVDRAIQEVSAVLDSNAQHLNANFNLGIFYYQSGKDLTKAKSQFEKVIEMTSTDAGGDFHAVNEQAKFYLQQVNAALASSPAGTTGTAEPQ